MLAGLGTSILTTSRGVMTGRAAVKAGRRRRSALQRLVGRTTIMSRIGKKPIPIPKGVTVKVVDGAVEVQGPKGKLRQALPAGIDFELADGHLVAKRATEDPELGKFHGLARSLVANAVAGVTEGFKQGARHRRRRLPRRGEGQAGDLRARLLARGGVRHPDRGSTSRSTSRRTSR